MTVCAVSSWLSSMIVILPADSGSLSATFPITATWSPSSITIGRRSSTTAPPSVWMNVVSSSKQPHELALRPGRHLDPHRLHTWTFERRICRPIRARAREAGQNRSEPLLCGRQSLRDRRLDVDVLEQRVDRLGRDLCSDLVVLDHVPRDRLEAGLVERRVLDVERDHPDEREQDRQDGQHARADQSRPRQPSGLWALRRPQSSHLAAVRRRLAPPPKRDSLSRLRPQRTPSVAMSADHDALPSHRWPRMLTRRILFDAWQVSRALAQIRRR